jgi:hypothetical protein
MCIVVSVILVRSIGVKCLFPQKISLKVMCYTCNIASNAIVQQALFCNLVFFILLLLSFYSG